MSYFLWVEIQGFYVDLYDERDKPLVVAREKLVLDANLLARKRGVRLGMEVRQAKAVVSECVVKNWEREDYLLLRNAWLDVCTDFTGIIEPIDQHIAALDLTGHPNPFDVTERIVRELVAHTKLHVKYGAAPSVWIAKLAADRQDIGSAIDFPASFLADLPVKELLPASEETRNRLAFLGYRTIGEVAGIPLATLQAQFGREGLVILSAAQGRHFQPVRPLYPLDSLHESFIFDGAVELQEAIDHALSTLADRIGKRLIERGLQGSKLQIKVETEKDTIQKERNFTKPIRNALSALIAMRLLLQDSLSEPVLGIRVALADLEKSRYRQQELEGLSAHNKRPEAKSAVSYVHTVFGGDSVKLGSQIEVPRRVRVLRGWQNATGWR